VINGEENACASPFAHSRKAMTGDWIADVNRIWARGTASTLELGRPAAAKNPLRHGQWHFQTHDLKPAFNL